jgi:multiple RNA-binding domain-containing protein 1
MPLRYPGVSGSPDLPLIITRPCPLHAPPAALQFARKFKDPSLARPWSKHSEGSSAHQRLTSTTAVATGKAAQVVDGARGEAAALAAKLGRGQGGAGRREGGLAAAVAEDPRLAEFLAVMAPRSRAKLWANDELAPVQTLEDLVVRVRVRVRALVVRAAAAVQLVSCLL